MSGSIFGSHFRVATFGESHGVGVGLVIDGVRPHLEITQEEVQKALDRRKPNQGELTTPRKEQDKITLLSGVFEGKTTGTPVGMVLYNLDADPSAYQEIKDKYRPGHADYSYEKKYGFRDWRGSGRASGRETAARVAAGAFAMKSLQKRGVKILAYTIEAGGIGVTHIDYSVIEKNSLRAPDLLAAEKMQARGLQLKEQQDSMGGIIECVISGVKAGIGEPVFDKIEALLAHAVLSIGATKGFEIGSGFAATRMTGSSHNDELRKGGFQSNNAGGVIGGISTGQDIVFRVAVKPVSSIAQTQKTITTSHKETEIKTEGRHDVCICPRIVPVVEAMSAIVLEDLYLRQLAMQAS